jgi:cell fate regulator YaaT (PSP1 superfamily)
MDHVIGVRFKPAGKIYDFNSGSLILNIGDYVIVETENGPGLGTVASPSASFESEKLNQPLKKVFRQATEKDFIQIKQNKETETKAFDFCRQCIKELGLEMNLFSAESNLDASKLTFFFTADGRVDFRKLVKLLVKEFRTKIEMRQVGIRNQAKMCGGIGRCGRELCCCAFMAKFDPVSIKMAKKQGLSLNPTKISGVCGRLMCCLTFENHTYGDQDETMDMKEQEEIL